MDDGAAAEKKGEIAPSPRIHAHSSGDTLGSSRKRSIGIMPLETEIGRRRTRRKNGRGVDASG